MDARVISETARTITIEWDLPAGQEGYLPLIDGSVQMTDGKRHPGTSVSQNTVRISKPPDETNPASKHTYGVHVLRVGDTATYDPRVVTPPPPSGDWWASVQTSLPDFGGAVVTVTSETGLRAAINALKAGQTIRASAPFTVGSSLDIRNRLASPALIDLTGVTVKGGNLGGVGLTQTRNVYVKGGNITSTRMGIRYEDTENTRWHGFKVYDCGSTGVFVTSIDTDNTGVDLQGEITNCGLEWNNPAVDPHNERGTGVHGSYVGARFTDLHWTRDSRIVLDVHDQHYGAAIQVGGTIKDSFVAVRANRITFNAQSQVAGSGLQVWGEARDLELQVEATDLAGRAVDTNGLYGGATNIRVTHGRATRCCTNPKLKGQPPFQPHSGVTFTDCKVIA